MHWPYSKSPQKCLEISRGDRSVTASEARAKVRIVMNRDDGG